MQSLPTSSFDTVEISNSTELAVTAHCESSDREYLVHYHYTPLSVRIPFPYCSLTNILLSTHVNINRSDNHLNLFRKNVVDLQSSSKLLSSDLYKFSGIARGPSTSGHYETECKCVQFCFLSDCQCIFPYGTYITRGQSELLSILSICIVFKR